MKKGTTLVALVAAAVLVFASGNAHAVSGYLTSFNSTYGTSGTVLNTCNLCHTAVPSRNSYGNAYGNNGHNFAAIENLDSDGDGFTNIAEINARTFPGDASSKPAAGDTTAPTVTSFSIPSSSSSLTVPISVLAASDTVGVTGYLVNESATKPAATASGWMATPPASYTFASAGTKTLYAWAKDAAGNVSNSRSAAVTITIAAPPPPAPTPAPPPATGGYFWDPATYRMGINTSSPQYTLDVVAPDSVFRLGDNTADNTTKAGRIVVRHYNNSQLPLYVFGAASTSTNSFVAIGGGSPMGNAATQLDFFTAPNTVTLAGYPRMTIDGDGNVGIGTQTPTQKLVVNGGMMLDTTDPKPACGSATRGTFWFTQDDVNGDSAEVCARVGGSFGWRRLF